MIFQLGRIPLRGEKSEFLLRAVNSLYVNSAVCSGGECYVAQWTGMSDSADMTLLSPTGSSFFPWMLKQKSLFKAWK